MKSNKLETLNLIKSQRALNKMEETKEVEAPVVETPVISTEEVAPVEEVTA